MARIVAMVGLAIQAGIAVGSLRGQTSAQTCGALICAQTAVCCDKAPAALCGSPGSTCCYNPVKTVANLCATGSQCDAATGSCHVGNGTLLGSTKSSDPNREIAAKTGGMASGPDGLAEALPRSSPAPALRASSTPNISATAWARTFAAVDYDPCWIHQGCSSTPGYSETGSMGFGWYCSDGVYVDHTHTVYDLCRIHTGCNCGVSYVGIWVCNC
mmetsp:Transcript_74024/g.165663  ORF Transcript_74024/g.165663 Transcript_74024/m.165663 type:complete len:215 (-) Transcript_74024:264-908(-)